MTLLIFDIDGTLTDTTEVDNRCFAETYKQLHHVDWENFNWDGVEHVSDSGLANAYFQQYHNRLPSILEMEQLKAKFMELLSKANDANPHQFQEITGANDLIQSLQRQTNYQLAMATGCWQVSAQFKLHAAGINVAQIPLAHADHHYSRAEITKKAIALAQKHYATKWEHIVYIGDGIWDANTTTALNIPFIGIDYHQNGKLKTKRIETILSHYNGIDQFDTAVMECINRHKKKRQIK